MRELKDRPRGDLSRAAARNRGHVLSRLHPWGTTSRTEIAADTGLSPATVSRITRDLVRGKVLTEVARRRATAGRPLRGLEINGSYGAVLGISLLPPAARFLVMNLRGDIVDQASVPIDRQHADRGVLEPLRKTVAVMMKKWPGGASKLSGVGLALPGQWDQAEGVSLTYPRLPSWRDVPIRKLFSEWTGRPTVLVGYAPALALAEQARRAEQAPAGLLSVEVAGHIAMGVVVNGVVVQGASGNAGELGHVTVDPSGPVCYCGNRGCLETVATCDSVEAAVATSDLATEVFANRGAVTFEDVVARARQGDAFSIRLLARTARTLGVGLAAAINLINPDLLVLSGRFFDAGELVLVPLRASLVDHALANTTSRLTVEVSRLGPQAAVLGAGAAAIREAVRGL